MAKDPAATRHLLLETAERLMAERGPEGVSMREISVAAGQGNNNAATYHFGSREALIESLLDRRMAPIDVRRAEMIAALGPESSLEALIRTVVVPLVEASKQHPHYIGFFAQLRVSPGYSRLVTHARPRTSSFLDVRDQIDSRLDHLPREVVSQRRWLCGALIVHALAEFVATPGTQPYQKWDDLVDGIVDACVHLLAGGPGAPTPLDTTSSGTARPTPGTTRRGRRRDPAKPVPVAASAEE